MPRESWFAKLNRHFTTHPKGRVHEILFWAGIGVVMGVTAFLLWRADKLSTPLALMLAVVSLCFVGWAFLPRPKTRAPPPLPEGRRGEIAAKVRASKAERKRKKAPPGQHPPLRRG